MHHRNKGRILGRERNQRRALIKGLLASLVLHGRIMTTEAKAKETKNFIDQLVNKAKKRSGLMVSGNWRWFGWSASVFRKMQPTRCFPRNS